MNPSTQLFFRLEKETRSTLASLNGQMNTAVNLHRDLLRRIGTLENWTSQQMDNIVVNIGMMKNAAAASAECQRSVSAEILQHIEIFCNQNKTKEVVTASVEVQTEVMRGEEQAGAVLLEAKDVVTLQRAADEYHNEKGASGGTDAAPGVPPVVEG